MRIDFKKDFLYWLGALAIAAGFILSIVSWMKLCSDDCAEGHTYRFFGIPLDPVGVAFFAGMGVIHYLLPLYRNLRWLANLMICGALGCEAYLIYLQKVVIGHWCPVCLSIFGALCVLAISYAIPSIKDMKQNRSQSMSMFKQTFSYCAATIIGVVAAFAGMAKVDALAAAEASIKSSLVFGNADSNIEVYVFTDWQCPACRKVEPKLERMSPKIMQQAQLVYVDYIIHPESMNFTPYNISFMINNKDKYWKLRHELTALSEKTTTPTDELVQEQVKKLGVTYKELNFAETALGMKYFKQLGHQFKIEGTPTVVIVNRSDKKGKKLVGIAEITETNVLDAIKKLKG